MGRTTDGRGGLMNLGIISLQLGFISIQLMILIMILIRKR